MYFRVLVGSDLHDHLATTEEGVADELARAQRDLRISHVGGLTAVICGGESGLAFEFYEGDAESNGDGHTELKSILGDSKGGWCRDRGLSIRSVVASKIASGPSVSVLAR